MVSAQAVRVGFHAGGLARLGADGRFLRGAIALDSALRERHRGTEIALIAILTGLLWIVAYRQSDTE